MLSIVRPHRQSHQAPTLWRSLTPIAKTALCPPHCPKADVNDQSSCLKVPPLRPAWPPSNSSRNCRGPDRTMLLLAVRSGLTNALRGLAMASAGANDALSIISHPIAQMCPRDRHAVENHPCVSFLDGTKRLQLGLPTRDCTTTSFSKINEPFDQPTPGIWPPRGGLCATRIVATTPVPLPAPT